MQTKSVTFLKKPRGHSSTVQPLVLHPGTRESLFLGAIKMYRSYEAARTGIYCCFECELPCPYHQHSLHVEYPWSLISLFSKSRGSTVHRLLLLFVSIRKLPNHEPAQGDKIKHTAERKGSKACGVDIIFDMFLTLQRGFDSEQLPQTTTADSEEHT